MDWKPKNIRRKNVVKTENIRRTFYQNSTLSTTNSHMDCP